jgi:two-component system, sensor histidine kinase and response regulator
MDKTGLELVNILIVDDHQSNLLAIEKALGGLGLKIVKAMSGNEALAHFLDTDFACVILDVRMPEMDGFELARIIRTDERTKYIPIIFASAHERAQEDMFKGYETGAVDYLLKPLEATVVRSKIHVFAELYRKEQARKRAEMVLEEYAQELARSNAELDQYASVVAHDLQAPLRRIIGGAENLGAQNRAMLGPESERWIVMMVENAKRMQSLIRDLLTYSQVGRGQVPSKLDLKNVISEVLQDLSVAIEESEAVVIFADMPVVAACPLDLRQLMQNLIGNAVKYRRKEVKPEIHISAEKQGTRWSIRVSDNGIGFDPKYKDKLFVLFSRLHSISDIPGTGIGLAICKKIVERYGGHIEVDSEPGKGSTFQFSLPDHAQLA